VAPNAGTSTSGGSGGATSDGGSGAGTSGGTSGSDGSGGSSGSDSSGGNDPGDAGTGGAGEAGAGGESGEIDRNYALWPMPNPPASGLPNPQAYDTSEANMVTDLVTGLIWERRFVPNHTFAEAQERCATLTLEGFEDWRTPAMIELYSIVDWMEYPTIDDEAFPGVTTEGAAHWSQSTFGSNGLVVDLAFGSVHEEPLDSTNMVRCVRAGGSARHRFEIEGATIRDVATSLVWERSASPMLTAMGTGETYCADLVLEGRDDFRLPGVGELATLLETSASDPSLDRSAFPDEVGQDAYAFWAYRGWVLVYDNIYAFGGSASQHRVRCVR
jgi:hypothetical protein